MNSYDSLLQKIENAKDLEFSGLIESVIELFKKVWLKGVIVVLILVGFALMVSFLFGIIGLAPKGNPFIEGFNIESYYDFYSSNILMNIPQTILLSTLSLGLMAAFYRICKQFILGENVVDDYFYFLKKEYFSKLLMLGIIHTAISSLAQFMFFIPFIYVFVPLSYFAVIFANNPEFSEMEIVKASFKLGNKKWLISFSTLLVAALLGMVGILGCGIGVLLTISIMYLPVFFIYKEVIGFDNISEIDKIGTDDVWNN